MNDGWTLVTFGAGLPNWRAAAHRLGRQAAETGWFDQVRVYDERRLAREFPDFTCRHSRLLHARVRGFGYWIWKPYLIWRTLQRSESERGAGVIYLDAGFELNSRTPQAHQRLRDYLEIAQDEGVFAMHLPDHRESQWTKPLVMESLSLPVPLRTTPQIQATPAFSSASASVAFAHDWYRKCVENDYLLVREPRPDEVGPSLMAHRHDQSVFSCLMKVRGIPTIPDETYWAPDWPRGGGDFPLWAMRNRTRVGGVDTTWRARIIRVSEKAYSRVHAEVTQRRSR